MPKKKDDGRSKERALSKKSARKAYKKFMTDGPNLYVASKVNELVKAMGLRMSPDTKEVLGKEIYAMIWKAAKRTVDNDRKTIRGSDF